VDLRFYNVAINHFTRRLIFLSYANASNAVDMLWDKGSRNYRSWGKKEFVDLACVGSQNVI